MATEQDVKIEKLTEAVSEVLNTLIAMYGVSIVTWASLEAKPEQSAKISAGLDDVSKRLDGVLQALREARRL